MLELAALPTERRRKSSHQLPDRLLQSAAFSLLLGTCGAFPLSFSECLEALLLLESRNALRRGLEVEAQGPLDGNLAETEMRGRVDTTNDDFLLLSILRDPTRIPVPEIGEDSNDILRALEWDLTPLVAETLSHRHPERGCIDELNPTLARAHLAVGYNPHVCCNSCVIEELLR